MFPIHKVRLVTCTVQNHWEHQKRIHQKCLKQYMTNSNPIDCSPPGSSVHGILQGRILEWVVMPSSRGSSPPWDWTQVFCFAGGIFTIWATREALCLSVETFYLVLQKVHLGFHYLLQKNLNKLWGQPNNWNLNYTGGFSLNKILSEEDILKPV